MGERSVSSQPRMTASWMVSGKNRVGLADVVVVEEIVGKGLEVVGIKRPAAKGNGDAELVFFIPLSVQRKKAETVVGDKLQQRAGRGDQRRRLVVVAIESAEDPAQAGNRQEWRRSAG